MHGKDMACSCCIQREQLRIGVWNCFVLVSTLLLIRVGTLDLKLKQSFDQSK